MRCDNRTQAMRAAQANANASGADWVVFMDTSGCWNAERFREASSAANIGMASAHHTGTRVRPLLLTEKR